VIAASVFWLMLFCDPTKCSTLEVPVAEHPHEPPWTAIRAFKTQDACWDYYLGMPVINGWPSIPVTPEGVPLPFDRSKRVYVYGHKNRYVECRRIAPAEGKRQ
jgi:hypothetical protein